MAIEISDDATLEEIFEAIGSHRLVEFRWSGLNGRAWAKVGMEALVKEPPHPEDSVAEAKAHLIKMLREIP